MPQRQDVIAQSIQSSILNPDKKPSWMERGYTYWSTFKCLREDLFKELRKTWSISEEMYRKSFKGSNALSPMGDMGYSGSTFFKTSDSAYLIKSVPRHFEHSFFKNDLLGPYADFMKNNPHSLLVRITDFLEHTQHSLGTMFGTAPSHHIVMETIMYGQSEDNRKDGDGKLKWESWDLKPMSYFYPERDVAGGALASEATKSKLADEFPDKILLTLDQAEDFRAQLEKDTKLLSDCNAVDYSLFLVRIPTKSSDPPEPVDGAAPPAEPPFVPPSPPSWRVGVASADGKYIFRAAILDFFWAKHKVHAKAMTGLINMYNVFDRQGPMSVTTEAPEYRERFLKMCQEIVEVKEEAK